MDLRKYIAETERTYHYRLKTLVPITDEVMDKIERAIMKYDPVAVSPVRKTMMQAAPLDFPPEVGPSEVYMLDLETALPASPYIMQNEVQKAIGCPEKFMVVRGDNDPLELETERLNAGAEFEKEAKEKGMMPASLLTLNQYEEHQEQVDPKELYGNEATSALLDYLKKVEDERFKGKVDAPSPLFKWMDLPDRHDQEPTQSDEDFNAGHGLPKGRVYKNGKPGSIQGNLDNDADTLSKAYADEKGKVTVMTKKSDRIRKER